MELQNIKLSMFQGILQLRSGITPYMMCNNIKNYVENNVLVGSYLLQHLDVGVVNFSDPGKLGQNRVTWHPEEPLNVRFETVGSFNFKCYIPATPTKISVLVFPKSNKVKISGGMVDSNVLKGLGHEVANELSTWNAAFDLGIQLYFQDVSYILQQILCGTVDYDNRLNLSLLNGIYDTMKHITDINKLSVYAHSTNAYNRVCCPEPEINGRQFAMKIYHVEGRNYHCAFDHRGKVQVFSALSYSEIYDSCVVAVDLLKTANDNGIVSIIDRK